MTLALRIIYPDAFLHEKVKFEQNISANGVTVLWAENSGEAQQYFLEIAKKHSASKIVKSKSMTTEEIGFNEFIKKLGENINCIINNHQEFPFEILATQLGESMGFDHRYFSNINYFTVID